MGSADLVSEGAKTIISGRGCGDDHHGHYRRHDCDDNTGLHLLQGQRALSHEIGEGGRLNDASDARILRAIGDVGERGTANALALAKALNDSEGRMLAAIALSTKSADDNARAILKENNDNQKALAATLLVLQMKQCDSEKEVLKVNFENTIRVLEKVGEICGPRLFRECGHGSTVISK